MQNLVIEVSELIKNYGRTKAVNNISFSVQEGEIFGMVGPNGAGKTTTIECIEGLRKPDSGRIDVLGINPSVERKKLYAFIGVQLQETSYPDKLKVWELCKLFSALYTNPLPYEKLLDRFGLIEKRNADVSKLSGGQRQRLSVILALIPNPKVVFLDEITTGLDPQARHNMWDMIRELKKEGRTIYLTSHNMDEVETLCDRVAIIDHGEIIGLDTVKGLINSIGMEEAITLSANVSDIEKFRQIEGVKNVNRAENDIILTGAGKNLLVNTVNFIQKEGIELLNINYRKPDLEDVFLKLTGRKLRN